MTADAKRKKSGWWLGTLLLLGLPAMVVAALGIYVHAANARPQKDPLHVWVKPQVVFPWQEAHFLATVAGQPKEVTKPPEPLDIAFLVDVSGSMTASIPTMAEAVRQMTHALADGNDVRFALVRFDVPAEVLVPWTRDEAALDAGLKDLQAMTGGNDPYQVFQRIGELSATARPGKRVMVFYTDGDISVQCPGGFLARLFSSRCPPENMSYDEAAAASRPLRDQGIDFFCVGPPGAGVNPVMLSITGSSDRIFQPNDIRDLASNFAAIGDAVAKRVQVGAQLSHLVDGRQFRVPLEGTSWIREPSGALRLDVGRKPQTATTYAHPLVPLQAGLWQVGSEPLRLTYGDATGKAVEARAETRPHILVLTWAVLLFPFLPWLLWLLARSLAMQPVAVVQSPAVPVRAPPLPTALPPLPELPLPPPAVPTLFIGLGRAGLEALHAVRADLEQVTLGAAKDIHRFLALDVDQREPAASPFAGPADEPIQRIVPPREVVQLRDFIPRPGDVPLHLAWLDAPRYEHSALEALNLADGSKGDRALARLALFRWLAAPECPLVPTLAREIEALQQIHAGQPSVTRQIVIVGGPGGGVGSGWFTDLARLLRRLIRAGQRGSEIVPEIVGVLVSTQDGEPGSAANRGALLDELESTALTGRFPRHVVLLPGNEMLDRTDTENPVDFLVEVGDPDPRSAAAQSAALAALLCQNAVRSELLRDVAAQPHIPATLVTTGLHVMATSVRDQVQSDLLLRLLGPDVLLEIEPVRGGYAPRKPKDSTVEEALDAWVAEEPASGPLHALLGGGPITDATVEVLRVSANRRLRQLRPVLAAATLRLFAERAGDGSSAAAFAIPVAEALDRWIAELSAFAAKAAERQRSVAERLERARRLHRRRYLDAMIDPKSVEEASRACLESWLGTKDTLSRIRERLFFQIEPNGAFVLRSHIDGAAVLASPAEAGLVLDAIARALAATVPSIRLSSAVARLDEAQRDEVVGFLLDSGIRADSVMVAAPADLDDLRRSIGQPAGDGVRHDATADDLSSLHRLSVAPPAAQPVSTDEAHYVEAAEREADRIRGRIAERYRIRVPPLPAELRVAAAHPSRFRDFARAYESGGIVRRADERGASRWYALDRREFLGVEGQSELAGAAANYVYSLIPEDRAVAPRSSGDFTALDEGIAHGGNLSRDGLVQAAIRIAGES